ncbi:MAG TPA: DUF3097 domain-containing protein [Nocardioidaceae bacterium]|nr:DUF3097 domain-containing protein [Nocardioidaceae bacterium]
MTDRYGNDVLAGNWRRPKQIRQIEVDLSGELVLEDPDSGFVGAAVRIEQGGVELEDRFGKRRSFRLEDTFLLDGKPVTLRAPRKSASVAATRTASGSRAVADARARTARASRIYVEGRHDAELVERVWGDDLRIEGVVVEPLGGIDDLAEIVDDFQPTAGRRLGVLVDHLVPGSKEARIADEVEGEHVLVVGHPYVDIWQAVKPTALGIASWPEVPKGQSWKHGVLTALGWPASTPADVAAGWQRILSRVNSYADLEPDLLGRVEELIDFVTAPGR